MKGIVNVARLARLAGMRANGKQAEAAEKSFLSTTRSKAAMVPAAVIPTASERAATQISRAIQNLEAKKRQNIGSRLRMGSVPGTSHGNRLTFRNQIHHTGTSGQPSIGRNAQGNARVYTGSPIIPTTTQRAKKRARPDDFTPVTGFVQIISQAHNHKAMGAIAPTTSNLSQQAKARAQSDDRVEAMSRSNSQINASHRTGGTNYPQQTGRISDQTDIPTQQCDEGSNTYPTRYQQQSEINLHISGGYTMPMGHRTMPGNETEPSQQLAQDLEDQPPAKRQRTDVMSIITIASDISEDEEDPYEPPDADELVSTPPLDSEQVDWEEEDHYTPPPASPPAEPYLVGVDHTIEVPGALMADEMQDEILPTIDAEMVGSDEPEVLTAQHVFPRYLEVPNRAGNGIAIDPNAVCTRGDKMQLDRSRYRNKITHGAAFVEDEETQADETDDEDIISLSSNTLENNLSLIRSQGSPKLLTFATSRYNPKQKKKSDYLFIYSTKRLPLDEFLVMLRAYHNLDEDEHITRLRVGICGDWFQLCESSRKWDLDWDEVTEIMANRRCKAEVVFEVV